MVEYFKDKGVDLGVGIAAALIVAGAAWAIRNIVVPWFRRLVSDDVDPAGRWTGRFSTQTSSWVYYLTLAPRLRGWKGVAIIIRESSTAGNYRHRLHVDALKRGPYLILNLLGDREHRGSMGTGLFVLQNRGTTLSGAWVYRPGTAELPQSEDVILRRE